MSSDLTITADFLSGNAYFVRQDSSGMGTFEEPYGNIQTAVDSAEVPASVFVAAGAYEEAGTVVTLREGVSLYGGFTADFTDRKYETEADRENALYFTEIRNTVSLGTGFENTIYGNGSTREITQDTIIEGFTINGANGNYNRCIYLESDCSPVIQYNTIGVCDAGNHIFLAIVAEYSAPHIQYNIIQGGISPSNSYGISISYAAENMSINNNDITGGKSGTGSSTGISVGNSSNYVSITNNNITGGINNYNSSGISDISSGSSISCNRISGGYGIVSHSRGLQLSSDSIVINNLISGGDGDYSDGLFVNNSGNTIIRNNIINGGTSSINTTGISIYAFAGVIQNNIIFTTGGTSRIGIYEGGATTLPIAIQNNNIFDCPDALYSDANGSGLLTNIAQVNDWNNTTQNASYPSSGNVSIDLINNSGSYYFTDYDGPDDDVVTLFDNDWTLTAGAPLNVRGGGINLSAYFTVDFNGVTRTISTPAGMTNDDACGWSIGAYEKD
jgi:hypothetical protein